MTTLFDYAPPKTDRRNPAERGEAGIYSAIEHAERFVEGWKVEAYDYLCRFARVNRGRDFLAEEIAPWAYEQGCNYPPDARAWGGIIQKAGRLRIIEQTGLAAKNKLSGNDSTWRPLWRTGEAA